MQHPSRDNARFSLVDAKLGRAARLTLAALGASLLGLALSSCALYDDTWSEGCILECEPVPSDGCTRPLDCAPNETCGDDAQCHPGNCNYWGCVAGYSCAVTELDTAECVLGDGTTAAEGTGAGGGSGSGGSGEGGAGNGGGEGGAGAGPTGAGGSIDVSFCGSPADCDASSTCGPGGRCERGSCEEIDCIFGFVCDEGSCVRQNAAGCAADDDCSGDERCISGICTATEDLCFDGVQCATGSSCADGKCVPSCAGGAPCPDAFLCDEVRGICSLPANPCTITSDCGNDAASVCVDGACVPRAIDPGPDAPPTCASGEVWVDNGCLPDQGATFSCTEEGAQSDCANGLVCVHRTCFVPCEPPDEEACDVIPGFELCKQVPAETGEYALCGAEDHLGGECDPTRGIDCDADLVCVDGTCR